MAVLGGAASAGEATGRLLYLDGEPAAGRALEVIVTNCDGAEKVHGRRVVTDEAGSFRVSTDGLAPPLRLALSPAGLFIDELPATGDWGTLYTPRPATIAGRLIGLDGKPWAGHAMYACGQPWADYQDYAVAGRVLTYDWNTTCDDEGRFRFEAAPGEAIVGVTTTSMEERAEIVCYAESGKTYEVELDARPKESPRVRLRREPGEARATVHDERGNRYTFHLVPDPDAGWPLLLGGTMPDVDSGPPLAPGRYRLLVYEGGYGLFGGGPFRRSERRVTLRPGDNDLAAGPITAVPCLLDLEGGREKDTAGFVFPLEPPALDGWSFLRWPVDDSLGFGSEDMWANPQDARYDNIDWPDEEDRSETSLVRHLRFFKPGEYGVIAIGNDGSSARAVASVRGERLRLKLRMETAGAALALSPTKKRVVGDPRARYAVLIGSDGKVALVLPLDSPFRTASEVPTPFLHPLVRGIPPGKYELRWWYYGFPPRSAPLVLREGETTGVTLEP